MSIAAALAKLEEAHGDTNKLALATLDIILESHDPSLREAVEAASIPHWFTPTILATLLRTTETKATMYAADLQKLPMVEKFKVRNAWNIHETTRLAVRSRLALESRVRFQHLSGLAAQCFRGGEPYQRIEAIGHRLVAAPKAAEVELFGLWKSWYFTERHEPIQALGVALQELLDIPLDPVSRAWTLLCVGLASKNRVPTTEISKWVGESLAIFESLSNHAGAFECRAFLKQLSVDQEVLQRVLVEFKDSKQRVISKPSRMLKK